jgi:hypothetical protein
MFGLAIDVITGTISQHHHFLTVDELPQSSMNHFRWIYVSVDRQKGSEQAYIARLELIDQAIQRSFLQQFVSHEVWKRH